MFSEETIFSFRKHSFAGYEKFTLVSFRKTGKKMEMKKTAGAGGENGRQVKVFVLTKEV